MLRVFLFALAALNGPTLHAQNLVQNPNFDTSIATWQTSVGVGSITHDAGEGSPTPGAMRFVGSAPRGDAARGTSNTASSACVSINPAARYDLFARAKLVDAGTMSVLVGWFLTANCTSSNGSPDEFGPNVSNDLANGTWQTVSSTDFAPPPGMNSARVVLVAGVPSPATSFLAYWDSIQLGPTGTVPVTLQSFEVD